MRIDFGELPSRLTRMHRASLKEIVRYCDRTLRTADIKDYDGAVNGLQVENDGFVRRIAAAVDGTAATVRLARDQEADLLLVHHGLFWGPSHPWTGKRYALMRLLLESNLAVYSSHLPLDAPIRARHCRVRLREHGIGSPHGEQRGQNGGEKSKDDRARHHLCSSTRPTRVLLQMFLRF